MRYAALRTLIAISLGLILAEYFQIPLIYLIVGIVIGFALRRFTKGYSLYAAIVFISMLNFNVQKLVSIEPLYNKPVKIIGMIVEEPVAKERVLQYTVALKKIVIDEQEYPISGKVFAEPRQGKINLRYGDLISYQGKIEPFNFPRNPNLFDLNKYYNRRGILGKIKFSKDNVNLIAQNKGNLIAQHLIFPLRRYFFKVINHYLKGPQRALLAGMLLGEKQDLPKSVRTAFADTGLAHILAVSGLHVGILVGICILLFSVVGLSRGRWYVLILLGIIIFLYVGITGFRPSAIRAGLMAFLASFGFYLERRYDPLNGVFVAGIIILLLSPFALFEIGFQLSFAAAIAIIFFYEKINTILSKITLSVPARKYIFTPLAVTIAAQIGVSPFLVYYFFKLPLINIFANILIVPLVGFAIPLAFIVIVFNLFLPFLAQIFSETLWLSLSGILFITEKLGNLSFASIDLPQPSVILIIIFYTLVFMLFYLNRPVVRKVFILILLVSLNVFAWKPIFSQNRLRITCLDIYYGDATLVELLNGQNMLVNTGNRKNEILPQFLKSKGIKKIDLLVITNTHPDFYRGLELLNKDFYINKAIIPNNPYSNLINYLPEDNTVTLNSGEVLKINGLGINLAVTTPQGKKRYPNSLEIEGEYDNFSMLFTGNLNYLSIPKESLSEITVLKPSYYKYANWDRIFSSAKINNVIISERWGIPKWLKGLADKYNTKIYNLRTYGVLTITVDNGKVKLKQKLKESFAAGRDGFY